MKALLGKFKERFPKERFSIGLDIGTSSVKLIKLRFFKETIELCGFALEPVSLDLAEAVKKITQQQNINKVNIAVSGPAAIIRYTNFPKMTQEEMKQALKFEAQKHIPFSIEEVNLDSHILKSDLPDNKMFVLLAAAKKEFINQRLKLVEDAGLKSGIVDINSLALMNAFNFNYSADENFKNKTVALLDIGASETNLNILEAGGFPRLSRDIRVAGNNFTQKVADVLGVDFKSAESLKVTPDKERLESVSAAIEAVLVNLAAEIRTSFDYYESQSASSVLKILLSGGGSLCAGIKDLLSNLMGVEVDYWDPLKQLGISGDVDSVKVKELSSQLAVAVGLALRQ
jgi:type IV pilus assembly protein PilM